MVPELFSTYRDPIRRYILGMVRDPGEAEDLTQETFLRAYVIERVALSYRQGELRDEEVAVTLLEAAVHIGSRAALRVPLTNPSGYLRKIFTRLIDDEIDRRRRLVSIEAAGTDQRLAARNGSREDIERALLVEALLERMDSATRQVVEARLVGMSVEEIANQLGVTTNCVSQRLKNGLERLRKGLHLEP
jgi:RNA polymerase sigma factor (sigma-70 family)